MWLSNIMYLMNLAQFIIDGGQWGSILTGLSTGNL
jgi:hypothetical protein